MPGNALKVSQWVRSSEHLRLRLAGPTSSPRERHFSTADEDLLPWMDEELSSLHFVD